MKDYHETEAVELMAAAISADKRNINAINEVFDIIYDYYDENGDLEIDFDDDDEEETDIDDMVKYIRRAFSRNAPEVDFTDDDLAAMIKAEINYQDSLLND